MFEHRLGLALGRTIAEVRAMPYEEFVSWKTFFVIEPWGWHDREYRTASLLAMLLNINVKKEHQKSVKDFYRDMVEGIDHAVNEQKKEVLLKEQFKKANRQQKAEMIRRSLGV
jgi:hypothetical protein